jgi:hypothetical protein
MNFNFPHINIFWLLFLSIPFLAMLIDFFLSRSLLGYRYRLFVAPGIIIHEVAHAVACLLTGAKIQAMNMFDKDGGKVEHYKPKIPIIGQILISIAPIIVGVIVIYFLSRLIGFRPIDLSGVSFSHNNFLDLLKKVIISFNTHGVRNGIILYLLFSVSVTMNPSVQDLKNVLLSLTLIGVAIYLVYHYSNLRPNINAFIPDQLTLILSTVITLLILCLIFSIIFFAISKLVKPN